MTRTSTNHVSAGTGLTSSIRDAGCPCSHAEMEYSTVQCCTHSRCLTGLDWTGLDGTALHCTALDASDQRRCCACRVTSFRTYGTMYSTYSTVYTYILRKGLERDSGRHSHLESSIFSESDVGTGVLGCARVKRCETFSEACRPPRCVSLAGWIVLLLNTAVCAADSQTSNFST